MASGEKTPSSGWHLRATSLLLYLPTAALPMIPQPSHWMTWLACSSAATAALRQAGPGWKHQGAKRGTGTRHGTGITLVVDRRSQTPVAWLPLQSNPMWPAKRNVSSLIILLHMLGLRASVTEASTPSRHLGKKLTTWATISARSSSV